MELWEITRITQDYKKFSPEINVILTGGDTSLQNQWFQLKKIASLHLKI